MQKSVVFCKNKMSILRQHFLTKVFQNSQGESTIISPFVQHLGFTNQVCHFGNDVTETTILLPFSRQLEEFVHMVLLIFSCGKEEVNVANIMKRNLIFQSNDTVVEITMSTQPDFQFSLVKKKAGKLLTSVNCYSMKDMVLLSYEICAVFFYALTEDPWLVNGIEKMLTDAYNQCDKMEEWLDRISEYKHMDSKTLDTLTEKYRRFFSYDAQFDNFLIFMRIQNESICIFMKLMLVSDFLYPDIKADDIFCTQTTVQYFQNLYKKSDMEKGRVKSGRKSNSGSFDKRNSGSSDSTISVATGENATDECHKSAPRDEAAEQSPQNSDISSDCGSLPKVQKQSSSLGNSGRNPPDSNINPMHPDFSLWNDE